MIRFFLFAFSGWYFYLKFDLFFVIAHWNYDLVAEKCLHLMRGKTIMSDNCNVANCADTSATMAEKGEIMKRRRTHCVAEALNDVSYKNNTHRPGISIYFFLKDEAVWPKYTRFDRRHRGDFTRSKSSARWGYAPSASKTAVTNAYHLSNQGRVADEFS